MLEMPISCRIHKGTFWEYVGNGLLLQQEHLSRLGEVTGSEGVEFDARA